MRLSQIQKWEVQRMLDAAVVVPEINVRSFGVKGDGRTDDTTAIQTALAAGLDIYFPAGTYMVNADCTSANITGGVAPRSNSRLRLHPNAVLKAIATSSSNYNVLRLTDVDNVWIEGGTIQGERAGHIGGAGEAGHGIVIRAGSNIWVSNVHVKDCWGDGIFIDQLTSSGDEPDGVYFSGVVSENNRRQGMSVIGLLNGSFVGCTFKDTNGTAPQAGVDIEPLSGRIVRNVRFVGCLAEDNTGRGFVVDDLGDGSMQVENVTFEGCKAYSNTAAGFFVNDCNAGGGVTIANCQAEENGSGGIGIEDSTDVIVAGNRCNGNTNDGILLAGAVVGAVISGNSCNGNTRQGIYAAETAGTPSNCAIIGNVCRNNQQYGIRIRTMDDSVISGNLCVANSQQTDATYDNILVEATALRNAIIGNTCRHGGGSNQPAYGLNVTAADNMAVDNDLLNGGRTAEFRATSTIVQRGNRLTAVPSFASLDATPSVGAGDVFKTANASATTITALDNGHVGQVVTVIINDANTTIDFTGTTLKGNAGVDWTPTTNDSMTCTFDGTNWFCRISDNTA